MGLDCGIRWGWGLRGAEMSFVVDKVNNGR